jgi:hypothetical protein
MTELPMSESLRHTLVTRLACVNSALSFLHLITNHPAAVTGEEVLA